MATAPNGPAYLQANQHSSQVLREVLASQSTAGVTLSSDLAVTQHAGTPGWSVDVAPGSAFVAGTTSAPTQGMYHAFVPTLTTVSITPSDAAQDRTTLIVLRIRDSAYSITGDDWVVNSVVGTLGGGAPAVPADSLLLATVNVVHGTTSVLNAAITDNRTFTSGLAGTKNFKARAYLNSAQTSAAGGLFTVLLDTTDYDPNANLSSNAYYNPVPGYYLVSGAVQLAANAAGQSVQATLLSNLGVVRYGGISTASATQSIASVVSGLLRLPTAGLAIQLGAYTSAARPVSNTAPTTYLDVAYHSPL